MAVSSYPVSSYRLDAQDRLVDVNRAWLEFATANGAPELAGSRVLGKSLWRFVEGHRIRELYGLIFRRVRTSDAPVIVTFRCDSPEIRRFMRLVISHVRGGELQLDAVLEREEPRPPPAVYGGDVPGPGEPIRLCSVCKRVHVPSEEDWLEPEDAAVRLGLLDDAYAPALRHEVCRDCDASMELLAGRPT